MEGLQGDIGIGRSSKQSLGAVGGVREGREGWGGVGWRRWIRGFFNQYSKSGGRGWKKGGKCFFPDKASKSDFLGGEGGGGARGGKRVSDFFPKYQI